MNVYYEIFRSRDSVAVTRVTEKLYGTIRQQIAAVRDDKKLADMAVEFFTLLEETNKGS